MQQHSCRNSGDGGNYGDGEDDGCVYVDVDGGDGSVGGGSSVVGVDVGEDSHLCVAGVNQGLCDSVCGRCGVLQSVQCYCQCC